MSRLDILRAAIIHELGVDVTCCSRERELADAVKIFSHHAVVEWFTRKQIGDYLHRTHSTITHAVRTYEDLYYYDKGFRAKSDKVYRYLAGEQEFVLAVGILSQSPPQ